MCVCSFFWRRRGEGWFVKMPASALCKASRKNGPSKWYSIYGRQPRARTLAFLPSERLSICKLVSNLSNWRKRKKERREKNLHKNVYCYYYTIHRYVWKERAKKYSYHYRTKRAWELYASTTAGRSSLGLNMQSIFQLLKISYFFRSLFSLRE